MWNLQTQCFCELYKNKLFFLIKNERKSLIKTNLIRKNPNIQSDLRRGSFKTIWSFLKLKFLKLFNFFFEVYFEQYHVILKQVEILLFWPTRRKVCGSATDGVNLDFDDRWMFFFWAIDINSEFTFCISMVFSVMTQITRYPLLPRPTMLHFWWKTILIPFRFLSSRIMECRDQFYSPPSLTPRKHFSKMRYQIGH